MSTNQQVSVVPDSDRLPSTSALSVLDRGRLVEVIGRGTKVKFVLDQSAPAHALESELRTYLGSTRGWFAGGEVEVDTGERVLSFSDLQRLRAILEDEYKVNVANFDCKIGLLQDSVGEEHNFSVAFVPGETPGGQARADNPGGYPVHEGQLPLRYGSETSGRRCGLRQCEPREERSSPDGDVVVLGSLRGTVQAGANDAEDSEASIIALELGTARLQIGTRLYQHTLGKGKNREVPLPVIACVRGGGVEVMPFTGSFHRGKERKPQWQERRM